LDHAAIADDTGDEDEDLYSCMTEYLQEREKYLINLPQSVCELHQLKASTLKSIMDDLDAIPLVKSKGHIIILDLSKSHDHGRFEKMYLEGYCEQARSYIDRILLNNMSRFSLDKVLLAKKKPNDNGFNLNKFIDHETAILIKERNLLNACLSDTKKRLEQGNILKIRVCRSSPFHFLNDPLPIA
jgi:hypothetical protein